MATVLLADDNPGIREFCRDALEKEGYQVLLADDGQDALEKSRSIHPDLVILDVRMPRLDGLAAAERIRSCQPHLPVVFFTSRDSSTLRTACRRLTIGYVEKSGDLTELKRVVQAALAECWAQNFTA